LRKGLGMATAAADNGQDVDDRLVWPTGIRLAIEKYCCVLVGRLVGANRDVGVKESNCPTQDAVTNSRNRNMTVMLCGGMFRFVSSFHRKSNNNDNSTNPIKR
jgi:hypothetical protein